MVIGACVIQFLNYISLYRNTQHYATLSCSVKTSLRAGGTEKPMGDTFLPACFFNFNQPKLIYIPTHFNCFSS